MLKYWQEAMAVARRILIELWRRKRSLIFWTIFPLLIFFLNSYILAERANLSLAKAMNYAAPSSLIGAALFFSCLGGSLATVVAEREQKTLKRLFLSPLSGLSYFLGIFIAQSCIGIGQSLLVAIVAGFWGSEFQGNLFLGFLIVFLSLLCYVGVGFILGTQLARRTEDVNALVATFGVPLLILGGAFMPSSLFPEKLLELASFNPIYHMNEALTAVWAKGETLEDIQPHLEFLLACTSVSILGAWLSYQRMLRVERRL